MKIKKLRFFLLLLICIAIFTACQKTADTNEIIPENESQSDGRTEIAGDSTAHSESGLSESGPSEATQPESEPSEPTEQESPEEKLLAEQKEMYDLSIEGLDDLLTENRGQTQAEDSYLETIGSIYLFSQSYSG